MAADDNPAPLDLDVICAVVWIQSTYNMQYSNNSVLRSFDSPWDGRRIVQGKYEKSAILKVG